MKNRVVTWIILAVFTLLFIAIIVGACLVIILGIRALLLWLAGF